MGNFTNGSNAMRNCTIAVLYILLLMHGACYVIYCTKGNYRHLGTWITLVSCSSLGLVYIWGCLGTTINWLIVWIND